MNPIDYTLTLQRILAILTGVSFFSIISILVFLNPAENFWYIFVFLAFLSVFFTSIITLVSFWWVFSIRKKVLRVSQVNDIVYQSIILSMILIFVLVLNQTEQLNLFTVVSLLTTYFFYHLWIKTG
jgi:hypothetical protein